MAMTTPKKLPRAIRISRKLPLSSEKLIVLSGGEAAEPGAKCTFLRTGCPAHTC
jgi:hypothetical protein